MDDQGTVANPVAEGQPNLLTQDQVNKIVAREKAHADQRGVERGRREAEEKYRSDLEALNAQRSAPQEQQQSAGVSREVDADRLYQQVLEKFNREQERLRQEIEERRLKEQMTQVANNYLQKVNQAKTNYEDFDEITKDFDPTAFPQLTFLLSGIDNAGDILYDLAKNPMKLAGIDRLAEKNPKQAQAELMKLSKSILENRQAQSEAQGQNIAEPLDRLNPSRIANSSGKMSIKDLRSQPWLKA